MKSLYRRYRPLKLSEVVGQPQVTEPLIKSLRQGKISHAYLLIGPRGCGKTSVARILAHEINGFEYEIEDDYIDIIEIDGASNRGIDNIRELREKVAIAPTSGKYKVYIIDEVHMLTKEAFNALLKTLEEPPAHAVFIMATTDAYKVPITITSRAQTYTFKLADENVMFEFLKTVVTKEKISIEDDALKTIVKRGGGSFRDSLSLLDQISTLSDQNITKDMVINALGLPQDESISELLSAYESNDTKKISDLVKDLLVSGIKPETITDELIATIVANPSPRLMPLLSKLPEVKAPYAEAKLLVALIDGQASTTHVSTQKTVVIANNATSAQKTISTAQTTIEKMNNAPFNWQNYIIRVQEKSDAIFSQLSKCKYEYANSTLHVYPMKKIIHNILTKDNNKRVLIETLDQNVKITIHEANELPSNTKKDETLQKISDIMGGEVVNDGGGSPF